jgi:two-component system chemotaxis response regulator CheB
MIKVLVAESSEAERVKLVALLRKDAQIQVIGVASCGAEAVSMTRRLRPQVVAMGALDRSPRLAAHLDGLEATRRIMAETPTPIVVALGRMAPNQERSGQALLAAGAVAVLRRDVAGREEISERELVETLKAMSSVKVVGHRLRMRPPAPAAITSVGSSFGIIAIAASTGGPHALTQLLKPLPRDLPVPVVIVQHLAVGFVKGFAHWLDEHCAITVKLVERGEHLRAGTAYVAADGAHLRVVKHAHDTRRQRGELPYLLTPALGPPEDGFCPSASVLFESVAEAFGHSALAVILTGMGRDGVSGLAKVRAHGGRIIAQDQETSVVFGMPSVAIEAGLADFVLPIDKMASQIMDLVCAKEQP